MDKVIELAKQAWVWPEPGERIPPVQVFRRNLDQFAKLVRNAALEEAAQKCVNYPEWAHWGQTDNYVIANKGAQDCAAAIESLKEPTP